MKEKGFLIKGTTYSFFRADCQKCAQINKCISATGVTGNNLDYILKLKGYKKVQTPAMIEGIRTHEELLFPYSDVKTYGVKLIRNDLLAGKEIKLNEVRVCSRLFGFKGIIDLLRMRYDKESSVVDIDILDIKPAITSKFILQLTVYGLMMADPDFEMIYEDKKKFYGMKILPNIPLYKNITFHISTPKKNYVIKFMVRNVLTKKGTGYKFAVLRKAKEKRLLHNYGLWVIPELDRNEKERQRFFGRTKIITKTKPVIKQ